MPIKFRECAFCGRGILEVAFSSHRCEHKTEPTMPVQSEQSSVVSTVLSTGLTERSKQIDSNRAPAGPHPPRSKPPTSTLPSFKAVGNSNKNLGGKQKTPTTSQKKPAPHDHKAGKNSGKNIVFQKSAAERRDAIAWELTLLARRAANAKLENPAFRMPQRRDASVSNPTNNSPELIGRQSARVKFVNVETNCSCGGENENCFKCNGTGIEIKRLATTTGADTTLFAKKTTVAHLASFASDTRGHPFSVREKGRSDSSSLHDDYDDEATP